MAENPYVYNGHIELIKVLREVGELDDLRQARQKMSEVFPLSEGMIQKHIDKKILSVKLKIFSYPSILTFVLGAQKNRLIERVLLSTHNICFGQQIRK